MILKHFFFFTIVIIFLTISSNGQSNKSIGSNSYYDKAHDYRQIGDVDSAIKYYAKAKELFSEHNDSLGIAKCLVNLGIFATDKGDYFSGIEFSVIALTYFNFKDSIQYRYIHSNYNNLGLANFQLEQYNDALRFYKAALDISKTPAERGLYLNNIANAYQEIKNYDEAIKIYTKILAEFSHDSNEYARSLANIAFAKWRRNGNYNPVPEYLESLFLRKESNDLIGLNFIYAKLSDYYSYKGSISKALFYAKQMYLVNLRINRPDDRLQALYKLVKFSPITETKNYFVIYEKLDDSLQIARNKSKNQFALIRYETEKQKADNLILQQENTEKRYQVIILIVSAVILLIGSAFWYKRRKQRVELKAQNAIRENQLNTSKKVHDRVANKIYNVISEIENKKELDKDNLLDKLDHIYHTSRDISYEITDTQQGKKFSQQLLDMFYAYAADPPHVKVTGNEDLIWTNVAANSKGEIFIVLQELMTNMKKHSQATEVNINFHKNDKAISILYHDNGIGMPKNGIHNNGLRNTETRIKNISGTLTFGTKDKLGLEILISFPIN